jgi:hypothetical protein
MDRRRFLQAGAGSDLPFDQRRAAERSARRGHRLAGTDSDDVSDRLTLIGPDPEMINPETVDREIED